MFSTFVFNFWRTYQGNKERNKMIIIKSMSWQCTTVQVTKDQLAVLKKSVFKSCVLPEASELPYKTLDAHICKQITRFVQLNTHFEYICKNGGEYQLTRWSRCFLQVAAAQRVLISLPPHFLLSLMLIVQEETVKNASNNQIFSLWKTDLITRNQKENNFSKWSKY